MRYDAFAGVMYRRAEDRLRGKGLDDADGGIFQADRSGQRDDLPVARVDQDQFVREQAPA